MLVFEEMPLREIIQEFNRYNRRKLEIADPAIANVPLGGRYQPRDVNGFLQNLGKVIKIRVVEGRREAGEGTVLRIYGDAAQ
jgi:transmembrane sensor